MPGPLFKKAGSARWWCRVPNQNGGRHLRIATGHTDRAAALAFWRRECRRGTDASADSAENETILSEALGSRVTERKSAGRAAGTLHMMDVKGRQLVRIIGDVRLIDIDATAVDQYIAARLKEGSARTTIHKELVTLRGAIALARRQGYAAHDPHNIMPMDFAIGYKPRTRALSETEVDALLSKLPPKRAAIVAFIVATGATYPSEVANAVREDVKGFYVRLRGTKRASRDRRVPVPSYARKWLRVALKHGPPFERWANVRRDLHLACTAAKIDACSPNDLRRTFGHQLRARGVEPQLIAPAMGHADGRMVERVYGKLTAEELSGLIRRRVSAKSGASRGPVKRKLPKKHANKRQ